ncbi:MAG: phospholipase A [Sulfurospirillum sp.]
MNTKTTLAIITCFTLSLFASDASTLYKQAQLSEKRGEFKKAMLLYKEAANLTIKHKITKKNVPNEELTDIKKSILKSYTNKETRDTIAQIINDKFGVEPYRINYLLPATYDFAKHKGRKRFETKFQVSFKKRIFSNLFGVENSLYLAYTQTSFWQTAASSSPFRESNYEPELFLMLPYKTSSYLKAYRVGLLHQSNGQGGTLSRSWNRIYLQGYFQFLGAFITPRIWYRIPEKQKTSPTDASGDDNPDIYKYMGYGDLSISYPYKKNLFSLTLRNNLDSPNRGSVQFDWTFPILNNGVFGYLQLFSGYGESLIDYNKRNDKIGLGFAITR